MGVQGEWGYQPSSPIPCARARLDVDLIHIAPAPVFARLERLDDRMASGVEVLGGVLVLRGVAAADVPANQALAQVDPGVPDLQAILTPVGAGRHVANFIQM